MLQMSFLVVGNASLFSWSAIFINIFLHMDFCYLSMLDFIIYIYIFTITFPPVPPHSSIALLLSYFLHKPHHVHLFALVLIILFKFFYRFSLKRPTSYFLWEFLFVCLYVCFIFLSKSIYHIPIYLYIYISSIINY